MTDPLSIIASVLTVVDASKTVIAACSTYIAHARTAPKELQLLVEDLEDLNRTIRKLDELAKSRWVRGQELASEFQEWDVPLDRIRQYANVLKGLIEKQDLRLGTFRELTFRALWPKTWKEVQTLLVKIDKEKSKLQFATAIEGVGMVRKVYMLVDQRLPSRYEAPKPSINWAGTEWRKLDHTEPMSFYLSRLGTYIGWPGATYDFPGLDDSHHRYVETCMENTCQVFLDSPAYSGWKYRKTPGPSLLYSSGPAGSGKSTLCSQVIQDLRSTFSSEIGIAYFYFAHGIQQMRMLQFCIIQLAFQAQCLPESLLRSGGDGHALPTSLDIPLDQRRATNSLTKFLISLLPKFRRTYILLDGLDEVLPTDVPDGIDGLMASAASVTDLLAMLTLLLEQDLGNVNVATFARPVPELNKILELSDVSIRLLKVEYQALEIRKYVRLKMKMSIRPALLSLMESELYSASDELRSQPPIDRVKDKMDDVCWEIESAIVLASDHLYLAVDMFIDSILKVIQAGGDLDAHLREISESSEVMMQRDPEIMKQKRLAHDVSGRAEDDPDDAEDSSHIRKSVRSGNDRV